MIKKVYLGISVKVLKKMKSTRHNKNAFTRTKKCKIS